MAATLKINEDFQARNAKPGKASGTKPGKSGGRESKRSAACQPAS